MKQEARNLSLLYKSQQTVDPLGPILFWINEKVAPEKRAPEMEKRALESWKK